MEENIEKLKFPIGKYKAILEFNFSRTVEDIKTLESFKNSYGSVWTRMGPYGPWGLPGGFLGPPGALGVPEKGVKGGSPPGGARGALLGGLPISLRGILTYMP